MKKIDETAFNHGKADRFGGQLTFPPIGSY